MHLRQKVTTKRSQEVVVALGRHEKSLEAPLGLCFILFLFFWAGGSF